MNAMIKGLQDLQNETYTITGDGGDTLRPTTQQTRIWYHSLYRAAQEGRELWDKVKKKVPHISYDDLTYDPGAVYIVHTNAIEEALYKKFDLTNFYAPGMLIPKGMIASKDIKDPTKYSITPQAKACKVKNYLQVSNVATPTRYQGQEVEPGQTLYYLVQAHSRVTAREIYTVVTRCKNIKSLVIVDCPNFNKTELTSFFGCPIKKPVPLVVDVNDLPDDEARDREKLSHYIAERTLADGVPYMEGFIKRPDGDIVKPSRDSSTPKARTAWSQVKTDGALDYSYMPEVYTILERHGIDSIRPVHAAPCSYAGGNAVHEIDMRCAYPTMLAYTRIPIDGDVYETPGAGRLGFYVCDALDGALVCDDLAEMYGGRFLFSVPYTEGTRLGKRLLDISHKSETGKASVSGGAMRYGTWERHYIEPARYDLPKDAQPYYVLNEANNHELLMAAICSHLLYIMKRVQILAGLRDDSCAIHTDAIIYDTTMTERGIEGLEWLGATEWGDDGSPYDEVLKDAMLAEFPFVEFRINMRYNDIKAKTTLYQNFKDLPRSHRKAATI